MCTECIGCIFLPVFMHSNSYLILSSIPSIRQKFLSENTHDKKFKFVYRFIIKFFSVLNYVYYKVSITVRSQFVLHIIFIYQRCPLLKRLSTVQFKKYFFFHFNTIKIDCI